MNLKIPLGTLAIVVSMNACSGADAPGSGGGTGGTGGTGASVEPSDSDDRGDAGQSDGDGASDAGAADGDGQSDAGPSNGDGESDAGQSDGDSRGDTGASDGDGHGPAEPSDGNGHGGAGAADGNGNGQGEAGAAPNDGNGDAGGAPGTDGDGHGDGHTGGSDSVAGSGGSGTASGGSDSVAGSGGSGTASGGSDGVAGSGGSGTASGGSDGVAGSGGSGSGGSAGTGGSAGSGGGDVSLDAEYLFTTEQFGGNGRTCTTCHLAETGTISPAQVEALYSTHPDDPLFRSVDSEDGAGNDYTQLRERATFRATIALPSGVFLTSDPSATSIVLRRGVPSTINTPALDPVIMWDGRAPSLTEQALSAILGHAQATVTPTSAQLQLIAEFEQGPAFFSSDLLREYDQGGAAPTWPAGVTEAEQRGRRWFAEDSAAPRFNICGQCHGGPMTNETQANSGLAAGKHFQTANVSEFNSRGNPTYEFTFPDPAHAGQTVTVVTPDPGRALVTGNVRDLNFFKIPTLWGVKNTAPYFHDNSANTLEELMDHYEQHLGTFLPNNAVYPRPHVPTAQDKADIVAYLRLL